MALSRDRAAGIVAAIVRDLCGRRGLRQTWESIDAEVREQIRRRWTSIIIAGSRSKAKPRRESP